MWASYGPPANHSEHTIGETITFADGEKTLSGVVVYVCGPSTLARGTLPTHYIVAADSGTPLVIHASQVIEEDISDEPTMMQCPYCPGMHYAALIDYCPLNPNRKQLRKEDDKL